MVGLREQVSEVKKNEPYSFCCISLIGCMSLNKRAHIKKNNLSEAEASCAVVVVD